MCTSRCSGSCCTPSPAPSSTCICRCPASLEALALRMLLATTQFREISHFCLCRLLRRRRHNSVHGGADMAAGNRMRAPRLRADGGPVRLLVITARCAERGQARVRRAPSIHEQVAIRALSSRFLSLPQFPLSAYLPSFLPVFRLFDSFLACAVHQPLSGRIARAACACLVRVCQIIRII